MQAAIISNGYIRDYEFIRNVVFYADLVICADGGARHACRMGIVPDIVIGDLDSMDDNVKDLLIKKNVEIIKYPTEKDETDTQLAVEYAIRKKCEEIVMIGCLGNRFDHSFANVCLLKYMMDRGLKGKIVNENNEIYLIGDNDSIQLTGEIGEKVSLLPMSDYADGVTTEGLYYKLENARIPLGISYGISNVFIAPKVKISIKQGLLLIIKAKD